MVRTSYFLFRSMESEQLQKSTRRLLSWSPYDLLAVQSGSSPFLSGKSIRSKLLNCTSACFGRQVFCASLLYELASRYPARVTRNASSLGPDGSLSWM